MKSLSTSQILHENFQISFKTWGNPDLPCVLALHGWLDNAASFDALAPLLSQFCIIAIDFPGHGYSSHFASDLRYFALADYMDIVSQTIAVLNIPKVILLGHSMGGAISSLYASIFPEQVQSVIMIDMLGPLSGKSEEAHKQLLRHFNDSEHYKQVAKPKYNSLQQMIELRMNVSKMSHTAARSIVTRNAIACDGYYTWRTDSRLRVRSPYYLAEEYIETLISNIPATIPLLCLVADKTAARGQSLIDSRKKHFKNLCLQIISGNHHIHYDAAQACALAINDFTDSVITSL